MKTVAFLGRKGGSTKTSCSHLLAMAAGLAGWAPVMVQTDVRTATPPASVEGRPYWLFGLQATAPDQAAAAMVKIMEEAAKTEGSLVVLDGGANRDAVDEALAGLADLVIVPVTDGPEDLEVAVDDRRRLMAHLKASKRRTPVKLLLSRWPGRKDEFERFTRQEYVASFLRDTEGARLATVVPRMLSTKALLDHTAPESGPAVRKVGRALLDEVTKLLL
ncbi:hypothetical protein JJL56_31645 [Azospirillum sp. YIM DDC1]|uniref:ParA family protein n=1 Tax=Azospirillum aestuarii TaxID=2802052 RepID=A0ABS1I9K4_9PROT|nr:hypothetical protein [Azospirillum aestuarii]MBK4723407.1 hypothetical protein [Azospirillum aestuarii]